MNYELDFSCENTAMFIMKNCPSPIVDNDIHIAMYESGDRDELIKSCMALATDLARKHHRRIFHQIGLEDCLQIAYEALIMAVDGWKVESGTLATYATTVIKRALANQSQEMIDRIYIPAKLALMASRIKRFTRDKLAATNVAPTKLELVEYLQQFKKSKILWSEVDLALHANTLEFTDVAHLKIGEPDDESEYDFFDSMDSGLMPIEREYDLERAAKFCLSLMTDKQREAVVRHGVLGENWKEIAADRGSSPQAVQMMQQAIVNKIRSKYEIDLG